MTAKIVFINQLSEDALLSDAPTISAYNKLKATTKTAAKLKTDNVGTIIHVRTQARSGRKFVTSIQGLPAAVDLNRVSKAMKKSFECGGSVVTDPTFGDIIILFGDKRAKVHEYFLDQGICNKDSIVIH